LGKEVASFGDLTRFAVVCLGSVGRQISYLCRTRALNALPAQNGWSEHDCLTRKPHIFAEARDAHRRRTHCRREDDAPTRLIIGPSCRHIFRSSHVRKCPCASAGCIRSHRLIEIRLCEAMERGRYDGMKEPANHLPRASRVLIR
jgi:hypothetical protein